MMNLYLHLKKKYWDQIASGEKIEEYRRITVYWRTRLEGRYYENIVLLCGYPARDDRSRQIVRPWRGVVRKFAKHPHFENKMVELYAIDVSPNTALKKDAGKDPRAS